MPRRSGGGGNVLSVIIVEVVAVRRSKQAGLKKFGKAKVVPADVRRSQRNRSKPVQFWKGETLLYDFDDNGMRTVIGKKCVSSVNGNEEPFMQIEIYEEDTEKEVEVEEELEAKENGGTIEGQLSRNYKEIMALKNEVKGLRKDVETINRNMKEVFEYIKVNVNHSSKGNVTIKKARSRQVV